MHPSDTTTVQWPLKREFHACEQRCGAGSRDSRCRQNGHVGSVLEDLGDIVGVDHVLTDPSVMDGYTTDWTRRFGGPALAVVRPADTDQVSRVLRRCSAAGVPVIPQGGNTGLVGGSVPAARGPLPVILSTRRLVWIGPVDPLSGQMDVGAGTTLAAVQHAARAAGLEYGVDLGGRDTATIGGTVATNAGGIHVVAHGMTRANICGVEAVLADGTVLSPMSGLIKDNTGFDLPGLLCGSEGTLAVITAVRVRLRRPTLATSVALVGCASLDEALQMVESAVRPGFVLCAAEAIDDISIRLAQENLGVANPLAPGTYPYVALLEVADGGSAEGFTLPDAAPAVIAIESTDKQRIWRLRECLPDAYAAVGLVHKLDVSVPLSRLADFASRVRSVLASVPGVTDIGMFGHIGDGNLHVEFLGPPADDLRGDEAVLNLVREFGGSVSAEHGIGRAKADYLHLSRSDAEISAMKAIKDVWDPTGIMNPGVLFRC